MAEGRRRVALIITGGTIGSVGTDRLDLGWYLEAGKRLGDGELVARVPELERIAEVTEIPFRRLPASRSPPPTGSTWSRPSRTCSPATGSTAW
jgi:hypothetical protein